MRDQSFLNIFTSLAEGKDDQRLSNTELLLKRLINGQSSTEQDEVSEEVQYTLKRLIQGLASGRKYARLGYSVAFCQVLRSLDCVTIDSVLECIDEKAKSLLAGQPSKSETGNILLGKTFAYLALVHSKKLFGGEKEQLRRVSRELLTLGQQRSFLQLLCVNGLIEIIAEIRGKRFKKCVLPEIESQFTAGWGECTPDILLLILKASQHHHKYMKKFLEEHWLDGQLVSEKNFPLIADVVTRSTSAHPMVHVVNDELVATVIEQNLDIVKFWKSVIESMLLAKGAQEPKRSLALHVFAQLLAHLDTADKLEGVISPHVADILYHYKPYKKDEVGKRAVAVLSSLVSLVSTTDDATIQTCVIKCLVTGSSSFNFDKHTSTSTLSSMIAKLKPEASQVFVTESIKAYTGQPSWLKSNETNFIDLQQFVVKELGIMVTSSNELSWQLAILQFLFLQSFFTVEKAAPGIPHCHITSRPVSAMTRKCAVDNFYKTVSVLITTFKTGVNHTEQFGRHLDVLYQLTEYGQTLLQQTHNGTVAVVNLSEEAHEEWNKMVETLNMVHKKRAADTKIGENHAFELLFLHAGYQLFTEPDGAIDALKDLHVCYKKSTQRRKSVAANDGPVWFEVITELLLSMMFKESLLSRNVAKLALQALADHVTPDAFQQIVSVLQQSNEDRENENGLIGLEEDDEDMDTEDNTTADDKQNSADDNESDSDKDDSASSDDDSDESSSEDSGIDEDGSTDMADLKEKVKSALGDAAADSDDDDEDDDESDTPDLSDSEMFKLDGVLAAAFKGMKKGKRTDKKEEKEREKQLMDFKSRVLDLVEVVVKHHPTVSIIKDLVFPLLEMMEEGVRDRDRQSLANKATQVFKQLYAVKKIIPDAAANKDEIFDMLTKLMEYASKMSTPTMVVEVAKACLIIIRLLLNIQNNTGPSPLKTRSKTTHAVETKEMQLKNHDYYQEKIVGVIQEALSSLLQRKGRRLPVFFYTMIERYPLMFWPLSETLVTALADDDIKIFLRTQACSMLANLIHAKTATEIGDEHWNDFIGRLQKCMGEILSRMDDIKPHFIRLLLQVLEKVTSVSVDACKQVLQDEGVVKLQSLGSTISKDAQGVFRRVMQKVNPEHYKHESHKKSKKAKKRENKDKDVTEDTGDSPLKKLKLPSPVDPESGASPSPSGAPESPIMAVMDSPGLVVDVSDTNGVQGQDGSAKKMRKRNKKRKSANGVLDVSQNVTGDGETVNQSIKDNGDEIQSATPDLKMVNEDTNRAQQEVVEGSAKKTHKHKKRKTSMGGDLESLHVVGDETVVSMDMSQEMGSNIQEKSADAKSPTNNLGKRTSLMSDSSTKISDITDIGAVGNGVNFVSPKSETKKPRLSITGQSNATLQNGDKIKSPKLDGSSRLSFDGKVKTESPKLDEKDIKSSPFTPNVGNNKNETGNASPRMNSKQVKSPFTPKLGRNSENKNETASPKLFNKQVTVSPRTPEVGNNKNTKEATSPKLENKPILLSPHTPKLGIDSNDKKSSTSPKLDSENVKSPPTAQTLVKTEAKKSTDSPAAKNTRRKSTVKPMEKFSPRYTRSMRP